MTLAHDGGIYLKNRMDGVKALKASHPGAAFAQLSDEDALIIAHNAGEGNLMNYPGIPQSTQKYLENVHRMTGGGQSCNVDEGVTVGKLSPPLVMSSDGYHVNVEAPEQTSLRPLMRGTRRRACDGWRAGRPRARRPGRCSWRPTACT